MPVLCLWVLAVSPKIPFSIFTSQNISLIFREYLCEPLSKKAESKNKF